MTTDATPRVRLRAPAHHVDPRAVTWWRLQDALFWVALLLVGGWRSCSGGRAGAHVIAWADQDEVLATAADAVPGLLAPFLEPDPR